MKKIVLFLFLVMPVVVVYGQKKKPTKTEPIAEAVAVETVAPDPRQDSLDKIREAKEEMTHLTARINGHYDDSTDKVTDLKNRGAALLEIADTTGAIADFNAALQLDSTAEYAWNMLGFIYANQKKFAQAIHVADQGIRHCEEKQRFYLLKGGCYTEMDSNTLAIPLYDEALNLDPGYILAFYNRGYTWFKMHQYERAIADLRTALAMNEDSETNEFSVKDAFFYLATSYQQTGNADSALACFDKAIEYGGFWSYYNNKTTLLTDLKRYPEALQCINTAIGRYPDIADLYYARSNIYLDTRQYELELKDLNRVLALEPANVSALINKGVYYERQNNVRDALALYRQVIALDPKRFEVYGNMANIFSAGGLQYDSAVYYYQKALSYAPDHAATHFNYGNFFMNNKEDEKAIAAFKKAIALNPSIAAAYNNIATIYFRKKDDANAKLYLQQGLAVDENNKNLNNHLLIFYFDHAQYDSAIYIASKLISLKDERTDVYYKRGMSRQLSGMYENAVYDFLDCLKKMNETDKKENAGIYSNIGYCYMELKKWDPALKYFKTAVAYKPETDQLIGLFTIYYLQKDKDNFKAAFRQALKVEPKLKKGMKGIAQLQADGFFYTPAHLEILREIFKQDEG